MKQGSNPRRSRSRGNGRRNGGAPRNSVYDSNGPDCRVRGSAQQVLDKYLQLGRDAHSAGDRVAAEAYFQFAEHYYRILNANNGAEDRSSRAERSQQGASEGAGGEGFDNAPTERGKRPEQGRRAEQGKRPERSSAPVEKTSDSAAHSPAVQPPAAHSKTDEAGEQDDRAPAAPVSKPKPRVRTRTREKSASSTRGQDAQQQDAEQDPSELASVKEIPIKPVRRTRRKKVVDQDVEAKKDETQEQIPA